MTDLMFSFAQKLKQKLDFYRREPSQMFLQAGNTLSSAEAFYVASAYVGEDILSFENETIELCLLSLRADPSTVRKVVSLKTLLSDYEYTLSDPHSLSVLISVLNEKDVYTSLIEPHTAEEITWAAIQIMALLNMENLPFFSEGLKYITACFIQDGWTMPPCFFSADKFKTHFPYFDEELYSKLPCQKEVITRFGTLDASRDAETKEENWIEKHKTIIVYLEHHLS